MPFSATSSCTETQWRYIFEHVFKPAIEDAGLDYECRRSSATRGNLIKHILADLRNSEVVLADLTDQNANVFYELGVRHTLKNRTIIVAQRGDDISSDLRAYAYHVYDWKTPEDIHVFKERIRGLLEDITNDPERADNPVSDFLGATSKPLEASPVSAVSGQTIVTDSNGSMTDIVRRLREGERSG